MAAGSPSSTLLRPGPTAWSRTPPMALRMLRLLLNVPAVPPVSAPHLSFFSLSPLSASHHLSSVSHAVTGVRFYSRFLPVKWNFILTTVQRLIFSVTFWPGTCLFVFFVVVLFFMCKVSCDIDMI